MGLGIMLQTSSKTCAEAAGPRCAAKTRRAEAFKSHEEWTFRLPECHKPSLESCWAIMAKLTSALPTPEKCGDDNILHMAEHLPAYTCKLCWPKQGTLSDDDPSDGSLSGSSSSVGSAEATGASVAETFFPYRRLGLGDGTRRPIAPISPGVISRTCSRTCCCVSSGSLWLLPG